MDSVFSLVETVADRPLDPYLIWATATGFRDYGRPGTDRLRPEALELAVAVECGQTVTEFVESLEQAGLAAQVKVSSLYATGRLPDLTAARYCTARVPAHLVWRLLPFVARLELGTALGGAFHEQLEEEEDSSKGSGTDAPPIAGPVLGIIDNFVAFANPCFRDENGASRVVGVWLQEPERPAGAHQADWCGAKSRLGYGFELAPPPLRRAYPSVTRRATHGMSVAYLAAGTLRMHGAAAHETPPPTSKIIAVQMPLRTLEDASGGGLSVNALDGVRYILARAGAGAKVVVNLSYGTMAGPHDGTSILEEAFDQLIDLRQGDLAIVLPAGNGYEARGHAFFALPPSKREQGKVLRWNILPDDETPSFLEIWLPDGASEEVAIEVTSPSGAMARVENPGLWFSDMQVTQKSSFGVLYAPKVANGRVGTMILVAVAATQSRERVAVVAPHGVWTVRLWNRNAKEAYAIHAWIERDDTSRGMVRRGRQSYFLDANYQPRGLAPGEPAINDMADVKRAGSFNTIATGNRTVVVGGYVEKSATPGNDVAPYSGGGPTRNAKRAGPFALAVSEESPTLHGLRTAAVEGVGTVRVNGTSIAAPQVARQIAHEFGSPAGGRPLLNELRTVLVEPPALGAREPAAADSAARAPLEALGWARSPANRPEREGRWRMPSVLKDST